MEKKVFISHSQKDKAIADIICDSLEQAAIDCWIAPRDIPYGTDWAGEIADAIKASKIFLFILSQNSNASRQCPKEINIADNANIPMLCVAVDEVKMNSALEYHLSNKQAVFVNANRIKDELDNIVFSVSSGLVDSSTLSLGTSFNQDLEIAFAKKNETGVQKNEPSLLEEKLNQKLITTLMRQWKENSSEYKPNSEPAHTEDEFDENGVLSPIYDDNGKVSLRGVCFSLPDDGKIITVVYRIMTNYKIRELKYQYYLERLDSIISSDEESDDMSKKIFFVDTPKEYEELKILSFDKEKDYVIINEALLDTKAGKITISNAYIMHFQTYAGEENEKIIKARTSRSIVSIDPQTGKEIKQEVILTDNGEERYVTLESGKSYFTFKIEEEYQDMEAEDIGDYYRKGLHAFPQNTYQALLWYEKAATTEAYRKMADIFMEDPVFKDDDLAVEYAQKYLELQEKDE